MSKSVIKVFFRLTFKYRGTAFRGTFQLRIERNKNDVMDDGLLVVPNANVAG